MIFTDLKGKLLFNPRLADYTTWRVGGVAHRLYQPVDLDDLSLFLQQMPTSEPLLWLGLGSNSLIKDQGFAGTVVLTQGGLDDLTVLDEDTVRVEAGVSCAKMSRFCARNGLTGGEFWAGIPGTMGGALRMNAGCANQETWDNVLEVETINRQGERRRRTPDSFNVSYRHVEGLSEQEWFVSAVCRLVPGDKEQSFQKIKTLLAHRAATQPTSEYNCGSVFRNPPGQFAAQLIEACGLKGHRIGGAVVSTKHANFIINEKGEASAQDIESLIQCVQHTVFETMQTSLVREVHIIGDK